MSTVDLISVRQQNSQILIQPNENSTNLISQQEAGSRYDRRYRGQCPRKTIEGNFNYFDHNILNLENRTNFDKMKDPDGYPIFSNFDNGLKRNKSVQNANIKTEISGKVTEKPYMGEIKPSNLNHYIDVLPKKPEFGKKVGYKNKSQIFSNKDENMLNNAEGYDFYRKNRNMLDLENPEKKNESPLILKQKNKNKLAEKITHSNSQIQITNIRENTNIIIDSSTSKPLETKIQKQEKTEITKKKSKFEEQADKAIQNILERRAKEKSILNSNILKAQESRNSNIKKSVTSKITGNPIEKQIQYGCLELPSYKNENEKTNTPIKSYKKTLLDQLEIERQKRIQNRQDYENSPNYPKLTIAEKIGPPRRNSKSPIKTENKCQKHEIVKIFEKNRENQQNQMEKRIEEYKKQLTKITELRKVFFLIRDQKIIRKVSKN